MADFITSSARVDPDSPRTITSFNARYSAFQKLMLRGRQEFCCTRSALRGQLARRRLHGE